MYDRDLSTLRQLFSADHLDGHELDQLNFLPTVYQRIFFMEEHTNDQAHEHLAWLWDSVRIESYAAGDRSNIAVIGYPLTKDFRHWELFADVSKAFADIAVKCSAELLQTDDNLNRALTVYQPDQSSYVLPNTMLVDELGFRDRFSLFLSRTEVVSRRPHKRRSCRSAFA